MKPQAAGIVNAGTIIGDSAAMGIDSNSIEHIMGVLTNLYRNAKRAVAREYATNAVDAHIEAGVNRAIEVNLPSPYDPQFEVRDYGIGLSTDELLRVYSQYGASTKRETDLQTGMLGLGSKSALAYAKQFTVISRKNGVLTQALIFLNNRGAGEITIVDTRSTDEPNGTTIRVPIEQNDVIKFCEQAYDVYSTFDKGTILVDGELPDSIWDDGRSVVQGENFIVKPAENRNYYSSAPTELFVVQGNVAYPVTESEFAFQKFVPKNVRIFIRVPIGTLQFTPAREDVYYTEHSKQELSKVIKSFRKELDATISEKINSIPSRPQVWTSLETYRNLLSVESNITWNGETVPISVSIKDGWLGDVAKRGNLSSAGAVTPGIITGTHAYDNKDACKLIITNYSASLSGSRYGENINSTHRARIREYLNVEVSNYSYRVPRFILLRGGAPAELRKWIDPNMIISWDELMKATRGPSAKRGRNAQHHNEMIDRKWEWYDGRHHNDKLAHGTDGKYVIGTSDALPSALTVSAVGYDAAVFVKANQIDKFLREFPNAITFEKFREIVKQQAKSHKKDFDELARQQFAHTYKWASKVDDTEIVGWMKFDAKAAQRAQDFAEVCRETRVDPERNDTAYGSMLEARYPLTRTRRFNTTDSDLVEYVNAMYLYRTQKGN